MEKTLKVEGMMCNHCKAKVEKALQAVPGVSEVKVDLDKKTATVSFSEAMADSTLIKAVEAAGFKAIV